MTQFDDPRRRWNKREDGKVCLGEHPKTGDCDWIDLETAEALVRSPAGPPGAVPAEAVACLREALDIFAAVAGLHADQAHHLKRALRALAALESELAEKTARVAELEKWAQETPGNVELPQEFELLDITRDAGSPEHSVHAVWLHGYNQGFRSGLMRGRDDEQKTLARAGEAVALRDKRIAELESRTPVALDRGEAAAEELDDAIQAVSSFAGDFADAIEQSYVDKVCAAARSWAALQWREPSAAIDKTRVLFSVRPDPVTRPDQVVVCIGGWSEEKGVWLDEDTDAYNDRIQWAPGYVTAWLPLDALPALPSEPVKP